MDFKQFMRKIEGKDNGTTDRTSETAGTLDMQGIITFTRGLGYYLRGLAVGPDTERSIVGYFNAGYNGSSFSLAMGVYGSLTCRSLIFSAGRTYAQQVNRDTSSSVQEELPSAPPEPYGEPVWTTADFDFPVLQQRSLHDSYPPVGGSARDTQPRAEPRSYVGDFPNELNSSIEWRLRETSDREEGGVPSLRDERSSSECSPEDTW